jgi:hypothetical protein
VLIWRKIRFVELWRPFFYRVALDPAEQVVHELQAVRLCYDYENRLQFAFEDRSGLSGLDLHIS